ncbi:MAG: hemolysin secretion protein D [Candidatus Binatia bacterium]|nr:MAG: hemolysin secretion protein D [Candidatus Binatia bacterium]
MCGVILSIGCTRKPDPATRELPPLVRTVKVEPATGRTWSLSGTIRARHETPVAFRIGGQIRQRFVQAGERVAAGQLLFVLDDQDPQQAVRAAEAQLAAARAEAEQAERERLRAASLREQKIVAEQAYEMAATAATAARERVRAAESQLAQARNLLDYTRLTAPTDGIVAEVQAEAGQVVAPGQVVAFVALDGPREAEVFLPESRQAKPPTRATAWVWGDAREWQAQLREIAGSADPIARTWRARFALEGDTANLPLGVTVRLVFEEDGQRLQRVPASAVYENGEGAHVWLVRDQHVELVPVRVRSVDGDTALIAGDLPADAAVVALGVHLLQPGQTVRVAP